MKNPAQFPGIRPHDFQRIVPRVALMDNDIKPKLGRQFELLLKQTRLFGFISAVVDFGLDLLFRRRLKRLHENLSVLALFRELQTRQRVIIQTRFADRDDPRILRQLA